MVMNGILNKIKESNKISISFHTSPDGDSLGSSLGLLLGLRILKKECYILSKEQPPKNFEYLPNINEVGVNKEILPGTDLLIVLDCGNVERINSDSDINKLNCTVINIDHHITNDTYGELNYIDTNAAAVSEIVYQMLNLLGVELTQDIATCLYTSIVTDTGSFKHSNTTSVTHTIAGDFINTGINFSKIHSLIFDNKSLSEVKLLGRVLDNMYLACNNKLAVIKVTKELLSSVNANENETSDLVSQGLKISGVEVSLLLKESDKGTKLSLRSKNDFDVKSIAEKFNGGGHIKAAGGLLKTTIDEAESILVSLLEKEL